MNSQLPDGVYIATNEKLTKVSEYRESNPDARVAVKFSNHVVVISTKNTPELGWESALDLCAIANMRAGKRIEREIIRIFEDEVKEALNLLGHDPMPQFQWLEESYSDQGACAYIGLSGNVGIQNIYNHNSARPITSFDCF